MYTNVKIQNGFPWNFSATQKKNAICFLVYLMTPCQLQTLFNAESETVECHYSKVERMWEANLSVSNVLSYIGTIDT